ncbi:MAG: RNA polymerase sigma-70 factor [Bacteroidales bacterium]|jgi:RNA polymerase sigma-70 factor (ECF subfamily)|nr:RNA polymerase sigma-70 factor [Bacteroidales bacterium]
MLSIPNDRRFSHFRELYENYFAGLVHFARKYITPDVAEDIVQDIFLDLCKSAKNLDRETAHSYLFAAVRNRCINSLKQQQVMRSFEEKISLEIKQQELEYIDSTEKLIIKQEELQSIYDQIEKLPDKCRQIFKLSYCEDKNSREIAELLGLSVRTVEHQLYIGLKTLRAKLAPTEAR